MRAWLVRGLWGPILCVVVAAGTLWSADVLSELGVTAAVAQEQVLSGVGAGRLNHVLVAPAFKQASGTARAMLVEGAVAWAKAYTASPEFRTAYAAMREHRKPEAPRFQGTPDEEYARQREQQDREQAKAAEDMKKATAGITPEQRKDVEAAMAQAAAVMKQMDTPETRKMLIDGIRMRREEESRQYQESLARWEREFPADPKPVIARRLQAFLDASATVDFQAKVAPHNGRMRFVNAEYESRPAEWKLCYRAGPEAVAAARAAAATWLKELR